MNISKKVKKIIPLAIVLLSFLIMLFTVFDSIDQYNKIENKIKSQEVIYQNELKYKDTLADINNLSEEELNEIVIRKAHESGYIFPNEVVFYDIQE